MAGKMSIKSESELLEIDTYFSVFLDQSDGLALLLDHDFNIVNLNCVAKKHYKTSGVETVGKSFSFFEKNPKVLELLDKIERHPKGALKLLALSSDSKNNSLPISWVVTNLGYLHKNFSYLIVGHALLTKQHIKKQNDRIDSYLKEMTSCMPGNFYWKNKVGRYLGCNQALLKTLGLKKEDIIGKTDYDLWPEQAKELLKNDSMVMASDKPVYLEEVVQINGREPMYFTVIKVPLRDARGKVIGIIGNSLNISDRKEVEYLKLENELQKTKLQTKKQNERIESYLKEITSCMPGNFYWKDKKGSYLGCNQTTLKIPGYKNEQELIGKTDYDIWPEQAEELRKNDAAVMSSGKPTFFEETVQLKGEGPKTYAVVKIPLRDANGNTIGIIGNSLDITYSKEAECLKLENELQKIKLQDHEIFKALASQVAHDIRSPLASLSIIVESCKNLPESERITLRKVATSIGDIANNLLNRYKENNAGIDVGVAQVSQPMGVYLALSEILSEKKYQYKYSSVDFSYSADKDSSFSFIKIEPASFNRMISNIIDNAVDAFGKKAGKVDLELKLNDKLVKIVIKDNGKGVSPKVIEKIMNNVAVTSGKVNGNGLGLTQVRETLQRNHGKWSIDSKIGVGTKITLIFPRIKSPDWVAEQIKLNRGDTVIILDDDSSIHNAWETHFKPYESAIKLKHFESGREVIDFINAAATKDRMFLLADFELINQELDGLQVIKQTKMQQSSILVTSHYTNAKVRNIAIKMGVKILPKQLASKVYIKIEDVMERNISNDIQSKVDLVVIDDDHLFADSLTGLFKSRCMEVDTYYSPKTFLENLSKYAKNAKICMDNNFGAQMEGLELARQLYEAGYTDLYMLSGRDFEEGEAPSYLKMILKGDMDGLRKLFNK